MTFKEERDKFDEVVEVLKEAYETDRSAINEIIEMVMDDVFKDYPTDHLGTFAEFKHIDEFNRPPLPDDVINRSSCGWTTCDIQEAIRRAKEYEDKSKRRGHGACSRNTCRAKKK